jgi:TolB-like protein
LRYLFEDYAFDTDRRELHRGPAVVSVAPLAFDLLEYLIRNRERVVSKDEVLKAIWKGRIVSDEALTTRLNAARGAIGDSGEKQHLIKTLPRKGFRFVGAVQEAQRYASAQAAAGGPGGVPNSNGASLNALSAPPLSIVVLPFANIGGDPEQDYFADGVTESLTTDLSRIRGLFVIARNSAFSYKGKSIDVRQVGRELNVRYVLEGSVQGSGNRLRVNVQLVDAETANHLWAERFDKPVADLFDMQDEIVSRLANTLSTQIIEAEARRAERSLHPNSMDLNFQGRAWWHKGPTPEHMTQARGFFERALALDPENVEAMVGMASVDVAVGGALLTDDKIAVCSAAEANAIKALSLAPNHAEAHLVLGVVYIFTNRAAQGIAECEQALMLNPNIADVHSAIGIGKCFMGQAAETEGHIREALRLSPRDIGAHWWLYCVGRAKIQLGADAEAVPWLRRSIEANRNFPLAHFALAAALALIDAVDEARAAAKIGLSLNPGFTIRRFRVGASSDNPSYLAGLERICVGLRLAGVPEG